MIIGKRDKKEMNDLRNMRYRVGEAYRWLAEFQDLEPLWNYLLGRTETIRNDPHPAIEVMVDGHIGGVRRKMLAMRKPTKPAAGEANDDV